MVKHIAMNSDLDMLNLEYPWAKTSRDNQRVNQLNRSVTQKTGQSWRYILRIIIIYVMLCGWRYRPLRVEQGEKQSKNSRDLYTLYQLKDCECPT